VGARLVAPCRGIRDWQKLTVIRQSERLVSTRHGAIAGLKCRSRAFSEIARFMTGILELTPDGASAVLLKVCLPAQNSTHR